MEKFNALFEAGWLAKDWDPTKHPRAGAPPNPGWFATTDGGADGDSAKPGGVEDAAGAGTNAPAPSASFRLEITPLAAFPGATDDARIIPAAGGAEEEERSPQEERDDEEGATYFNPDTGRMVILPPGSGVVLGRPWVRVPDLPAQTYLRAPASETWTNPRSLERHFDDHADDFNARDPEEYAALANKFYTEAVSKGYRLKVESDGTEYIYDPKTNTFGIYTGEGKTITFFKPTPKDYWNQQPGHIVRGRFVGELVKAEGEPVSNKAKFMCPVCGYPGLDRPARYESGWPSGEYCPCCAFQFGYHDDSEGITFDEWRRRWVANGMPWSTSIEYPPPNWSPHRQLIELARKHHVVRSQEDFRQRYE